ENRSEVLGPDSVEIPQQESENCALGNSGNESGDWRRRALIDIRCPEVERNHSELKTNTSGDQCQTGQYQSAILRASQQSFQTGQVHSAELRVDERHSEKQESGR